MSDADGLRAYIGELASHVKGSTAPTFTSVSVHGAPGLEFSFTKTYAPGTVPAADVSRGRVFLVGDRIMTVRFVAQSREELPGPLATAILDSLRWAPP